MHLDIEALYGSLIVSELNIKNVKKIQGMQVDCQDPRTGATVECNQELPPGTLVIYQCAKHFVSPFGENEDGRMTCLQSGRWSRTAHYEEFACRLGIRLF